MSEKKNYTRKDVSKDTIELKVTIPRDLITKSYETLLEQESKKTNLKGFRKGEVPKDILEPRLKDTLLLEAFERLAPMFLSSVLQEEDIKPVAPPAYKEVPKVAGEEDVEITVEVTVMPEFKLGNMKKVDVEQKGVKVTQKEVDDVLENLKNSPQTKTKKISDTWAKKVGKTLMIEGVKDMESLKKELKKIIKSQKEGLQKRELESEALKKAIELCKIEIPEKAIDYEAAEREHSFIHQLEHQSMTLAEFATKNGMDMKTIREGWRKDAKEALEADVFLRLFAEDRKVEVTDKDLEAEITKLKATQGVDDATASNPEWREYVKTVTLKQKAYNEFVKEIFEEKKKK